MYFCMKQCVMDYTLFLWSGQFYESIVTMKPTVGRLLSNLGIDQGLDKIKDLLGETLVLELVS